MSDEEEEQGHPSQDMESNDDDGDDDDEGVPLRLGDEEEIDDEDRAAMFNLVMNEVLRQYREENGRGPDTKELLDIRATIARELHVPVAHIDAEQADWNKHAKDGTPAKEQAKTIGFHPEDKILEYHPDPNEHNHMEDYEYEDESANDEGVEDTDAAGPPKKRQKLSDDFTDEREDSKPAAKQTGSSRESDQSKKVEEGQSRTNDNFDTNSGIR